MPRGQANKDQILQTGRLAYGDDGTNSYPVKVDSSGNVQVDVLATETIETELLAITNVAASARQASTILSLVGVKKATFFIDHGRASSAAFGTNGTEYRVEVSQKAAGNDTWRAVASVLAANTACLAVAASADVAAGGTTVVVTSGTSIPTRGDIVFWANTVSAASSEWMRVLSVTGTASFVIEDGLTYGQDSDTNIFTQAEQFVVSMDVEGFTRARVIVNNNASGSTLAIYSRVAAITEK